MAEKNKIDRYGLGERVIGLFRDGKTTVEIADIITRGIVASGVEDGVDQTTVSRWLKRVREADAEAQAEVDRQTKEVLRRHVENGVSGDIDQMVRVQAFFLSICENTLSDARFDIKTRMEAGRSLVKLIDTKLRLPGVMDNGDGANTGDASSLQDRSAVQSLLDRLSRSVAGGAGLCSADVVTQ